MMKTSQITVNPFDKDEMEQYERETETRHAEILAMVNICRGIRFLHGRFELMYHPSAKNAGKYQLTVFENGVPLSDSQHDSKADVAARLAEYDDIVAVEAAV